MLRASRSQPVMSVLRSAGPRAPGRVCPVRLRPGPPSRGAPALGIQRRKRGNRGRFCRSSCWSCRSSCDWFYTFAPTTADTPPLAHIRSPQVPVAGLAQPVLQPPEPSHPIPFGAHRSLRNPAVQPSMGSHPNSTIQRPQLTCHHRPADFPSPAKDFSFLVAGPVFHLQFGVLPTSAVRGVLGEVEGRVEVLLGGGHPGDRGRARGRPRSPGRAGRSRRCPRARPACGHRHGQAGAGGFAAHQVGDGQASTQVNRCTRILWSVKWRIGAKDTTCGSLPAERLRGTPAGRRR